MEPIKSIGLVFALFGLICVPEISSNRSSSSTIRFRTPQGVFRRPKDFDAGFHEEEDLDFEKQGKRLDRISNGGAFKKRSRADNVDNQPPEENLERKFVLTTLQDQKAVANGQKVLQNYDGGRYFKLAILKKESNQSGDNSPAFDILKFIVGNEIDSLSKNSPLAFDESIGRNGKGTSVVDRRPSNDKRLDRLSSTGFDKKLDRLSNMGFEKKLDRLSNMGFEKRLDQRIGVYDKRGGPLGRRFEKRRGYGDNQKNTKSTSVERLNIMRPYQDEEMILERPNRQIMNLRTGKRVPPPSFVNVPIGVRSEQSPKWVRISGHEWKIRPMNPNHQQAADLDRQKTERVELRSERDDLQRLQPVHQQPSHPAFIQDHMEDLNESIETEKEDEEIRQLESLPNPNKRALADLSLAEAESNPSKGMSTFVLVATIAACVGVGIFGLLVGALMLYSQRRKRAESKQDMPDLDELFNQKMREKEARRRQEESQKRNNGLKPGPSSILMFPKPPEKKSLNIDPREPPQLTSDDTLRLYYDDDNEDEGESDVYHQQSSEGGVRSGFRPEQANGGYIPETNTTLSSSNTTSSATNNGRKMMKKLNK